MSTTESITIRPAYADDQLALHRLAALDSSAVPPAPLLVAEVEGELRAALSIHTREVIADPFHRTADVVALLALSAAQLNPPARGELRRRLLSSLLAGPAVPSGLRARPRLPRSPA